jgi:hypothetical protein
MVANPWTELAMNMPLPAAPTTQAADLVGKLESAGNTDSGGDEDDDAGPSHPPAWEGTLLPGGGGDAWLASAFAVYEPIVADELAKLKDDSDELSPSHREELGNELFEYRSGYLAASRAKADIPLSSIQMDVGDRSWYRIARGKGVMLLASLRQRLGITQFVELMKAYGKAYGGKPADAGAFVNMAEGAPYKVPAGFFDYWLHGTGLPKLELLGAASKASASGNTVSGKLRVSSAEAVSSVDVTVETGEDEKTQTIAITGPVVDFEIQTDKPATRAVVNKYGATPMGDGGRYSLGWFDTEPQKALIVYGTQDEEWANREAAEKLQKAIADAGSNVVIPIKADVEVMDDQEALRGHHLLLVGRPGCNRVTGRMAKAFPVSFGVCSFDVGGKVYANPGSVLLIAGTNPMNDRYSVVLLAGLSAEATVRHARALAEAAEGEAEVIANGETKDLVLPAAGLVKEFGEK